jgi:hypothetical protein
LETAAAAVTTVVHATCACNRLSGWIILLHLHALLFPVTCGAAGLLFVWVTASAASGAVGTVLIGLLLHLQDIGTGSFGRVLLAKNVRTKEQVLQLEAAQQHKQLHSNSSGSRLDDA